MGQIYCTHCLSLYGKYYYLKVLYVTEKKRKVKSGLYQCENCGVVATEHYKIMRLNGNHIIRNLENVEESS